MAWSPVRTVTAPETEPVSLAEVKEFVSIDADIGEFDVLLTSFIEAARGQVEAVTGTRLVEQTVALQADCWSDLLCLPIGEVTAIGSVNYKDLDGTLQTVDPAVYELAGTGLTRGIRPAVGQRWPSGVRGVSGAISVELVVGYELLPPQVRAALLLMVSDQFAFRESGVVGTVTADIKSSMRVDALLSNHRIWL